MSEALSTAHLSKKHSEWVENEASQKLGRVGLPEAKPTQYQVSHAQVAQLARGETIAFQGNAYVYDLDERQLTRCHRVHARQMGPDVTLVIKKTDPPDATRPALCVSANATDFARSDKAIQSATGIDESTWYRLASWRTTSPTTPLLGQSEYDGIANHVHQQMQGTVLTGRELVAFIYDLKTDRDLGMPNTIHIRNLSPDWPQPANELRYQKYLAETREQRSITGMQPPSHPPQAPVSLDALTGNRYTIAQLTNQLLDYFDISPQRTVSQADAQQIQRLLNGQKTEVIALNDASVAKLYVISLPGKGPQLQHLDVQSTLTFRDTFMGHTFSGKDKEYLERYGNMGRKIALTDKSTGSSFEGYIGVDVVTWRLTVVRAEAFRVPTELKGVKLNERQQQFLAEGKALKLHNMMGKDGNLFNAYVRFHAGKKTIQFSRFSDHARQKKSDEPQKITTTTNESVNRTAVKKGTQPVVGTTSKEADSAKKPVHTNGLLGKKEPVHKTPGQLKPSR